MSKEWKCADCVKYKTDACSTCACGYTPTVSCRDVLVDYDYAYQQGRADFIAEHTQINAYGKPFILISSEEYEQLKEQSND